MMERFFVYSQEHGVPIRLLVQNAETQKLQYVNVVIFSWDDDHVFYIRPRKSDMGKPPRMLERQFILSADYARGDHGDTLQFTEGYIRD